MLDTCLYKVCDGVVVDSLFDSNHQLPEDWYDSPKAAQNAVKPKRKHAKKFVGADDGDSTGNNQ